jgi:type I restriction enzyme S subunit
MSKISINLPEGWGEKTLLNLANFHNGAAFNSKDWVEDGLPIIRIEQINNATSETDKYNGVLSPNNIIDSGDLIFSWSATLKVVIWNRGLGALNQHLYKVIPKVGIDRFLLRYILDFNMDKLAGQSQGSTMKHVTRKELSRFNVIFPQNDREQKKIASILLTIDQTIEKTEALIEKYQQMKAGLMHDLFTRGITADGKLRPPREQAPELYQETAIGWIPKEWNMTNTGKFIKTIEAGKSPECPEISAGAGEWGVLKVSAVVPDGLKKNENKVIVKKEFRNPLYLVKKDDLLISRANTPQLVGMICHVDNINQNLLLSDKTLRIQIHESLIDKRFLFWVFQYSEVRRQVEICATGSSGSMKNISQKDIHGLLVAKPLNTQEQEKIKNRLDSVLLNPSFDFKNNNSIKNR